MKNNFSIISGSESAAPGTLVSTFYHLVIFGGRLVTGKTASKSLPSEKIASATKHTF